MKHPQLPIDGKTRLVGLIGSGITYSLSPAIHNAAIQQFDLNQIYVPFDIPEASLAGFLKVFWDMGGIGFNVTKPHKRAVAALIPGAGLGSVNTVYRGPKGWLAASTDAAGMAAGLARIGRDLQSFESIIIVGAGGAAQALVNHLATMPNKPKQVVMLARETAKADVIKSAAPSGFVIRIVELSLAALTAELSGKGGETLLIQATSAPLHGDNLEDLMPAIDPFNGVVVDLVYGTPSALYFRALARGLLAQDGEPMLIEQARLSQVLWWGKAAPYETLAAAVRSTEK